MATARSEPLSIESLLQKQREEKEAAAKVIRSVPVPLCLISPALQPRFLTKEERAKLAIAKRAQEIKGQKEREEASRRDREALEREADELAVKDRSKYNAGRRQ